MDSPDSPPTPDLGHADDDGDRHSPPHPTDASDFPPTPPDWALRYEQARAKLLAGDFADAALRFVELERTAVNRVDRATAHAQRTLADEWSAGGLVFGRRPELGQANDTPKVVDKRTTDEIVSLYLTAAIYGAGTGLLVDGFAHSESPISTVLPPLALTAGAIGTVIALDSGRELRYGVAQSIVSGTWIGFEHGLAWTLWHNARRETRDLEGLAHASILWGFTSLGAIGGGVLGSLLATTPGRSSWVGSTALWTGAMLGFVTGAVAAKPDTAPTALAATGVGLTAGTGLGLLTAGVVSPTIARVRLIDLSGILGGLTGLGTYALASTSESDGGRTASTALGIAAGLTIGWFLTASLPKDPIRRQAPASDARSSEPTKRIARATWVEQIHPLLLPTQSGGAMIGAGGTLD